MAFRVIREKKEARRNAKLAEIFMVSWRISMKEADHWLGLVLSCEKKACLASMTLVGVDL